MLVRMWMAKELVTAPPTLTVGEAMKILAEKKIRRLPVTDQGRLVGIVTLSDLSRATGNPGLALSQIMAKNPASVAPDTPIETAGMLMRDRKLGAVPVIESGKLVGIITETDIFRALMEVLGMNAEGTRVAVAIGKDAQDFYDLMKLVSETERAILSVVIYSSYSRERSLVVMRVAGTDREQISRKLSAAHLQVIQVG